MMTREDIDELLQPPTELMVGQVLRRFATEVERHYRGRLKGLYLFGSRARGDHRPDSDADVAVVLEDGDWEQWIERRTLNRLAYEPSLDSGLAIQPWPFSLTQWESESPHASRLVVNARREAQPFGAG